MKLHHVLKNLRARADLTQIEVAKKMGTFQPNIVRLESPDAEMTICMLKRYVEACGATLSIGADLPTGYMPILGDIDEQALSELQVVTLTLTDLTVEREYSNNGCHTSTSLIGCLYDNNTFVSQLTIDNDRLPASITAEAILEVAQGSLTFDAGDEYLGRDFVLSLTQGQIELIEETVNEIKAQVSEHE